MKPLSKPLSAKTLSAACLIASFMAGGCAAATVPSGAGAASPAGSPGGDQQSRLVPGDVLFIDRDDVRLGTTIHLGRVPTSAELNDFTSEHGSARVVMSLDAWPTYDALRPLDYTPEGVELVALVAGFPPSRGAADAWGLLRVRVRIIVIVGGPPVSSAEIDDVNVMRGVERVIARMQTPSRAGFERLQRPLSFWKAIR